MNNVENIEWAQIGYGDFPSSVKPVSVGDIVLGNTGYSISVRRYEDREGKHSEWFLEDSRGKIVAGILVTYLARECEIESVFSDVRGAGKVLIGRALDEIDLIGMECTLNAVGKFGRSVENLVNYYEQFGFDVVCRKGAMAMMQRGKKKKDGNSRSKREICNDVVKNAFEFVKLKGITGDEDCIEAVVNMHSYLRRRGFDTRMVRYNAPFGGHWTLDTDCGEFDPTISNWRKPPVDSVPGKLYLVTGKSPHKNWEKDPDVSEFHAYASVSIEEED